MALRLAPDLAATTERKRRRSSATPRISRPRSGRRWGKDEMPGGQLFPDNPSVREETTAMPTLIEKPARVQAAGTKPKVIDEYVGHVCTGHAGVSIAHMRSPGGWVEPAQTPDFEEY